MRLHEIEFKSEKDFEDWLKRKQDRFEKYKRKEFDMEKYKDSPFWRGWYAGKKVVNYIPDKLEKLKRSEFGQSLKRISDLSKGTTR